MDERETAEAIADRAADWVARLDHVEDDAAVTAELEAWLGGDVRRRGAYLRARAAWVSLDRAQVLGHAADPYVSMAPRSSLGRWGRLGGVAALAAALVLTIGLWPSAPVRIETAVGEIRRVPLADGSIAAVNTATRLAVHIDDKRREVELNQGEAWFQVAHDTERPFIVEAGDLRVRAVGTAFAVRRLPDGTSVQVTEGKVAVWRLGAEGGRQFVAAGASTFVSTGGAAVASAVGTDAALDRRLAWRSGQLVFSGDTLGQAAREFNRYNKMQVRIADPDLAAETFVGRFRTNEPEAFARAAAGILHVRLEQRGDELVLSRD